MVRGFQFCQYPVSYPTERKALGFSRRDTSESLFGAGASGKCQSKTNVLDRRESCALYCFHWAKLTIAIATYFIGATSMCSGVPNSVGKSWLSPLKHVCKRGRHN